MDRSISVSPRADNAPAATRVGTTGIGTPAWFVRTAANSRQNAYKLMAPLRRLPTGRCVPDGGRVCADPTNVGWKHLAWPRRLTAVAARVSTDEESESEMSLQAVL